MRFGRLILIALLVAMPGLSASRTGAFAQANDNWRWQQQQRAMDEQRRQQDMMRQEQQRRQQEAMRQEQQRQQMETARRQQEMQRQQEQARRLSEEMRRRQANDNQNRIQQQRRIDASLATSQKSLASSRSAAAMVKAASARQETSRKLADLSKPPSLAEIKKGFRGQFAADGRAVVRVRGRTMLVSAASVGRSSPVKLGVGSVVIHHSVNQLAFTARLSRGGGGRRPPDEPPDNTVTRAANNNAPSPLPRREGADLYNSTASRTLLDYNKTGSAWNKDFIEKAGNEILKTTLERFSDPNDQRGNSVRDFDMRGLTVTEILEIAKGRGFVLRTSPEERALRVISDTETDSAIASGACENKTECFRLLSGGYTSNSQDSRGVARHYILVHRDGGMIRIKPDGEPRLGDEKAIRPGPHVSKSVLGSLTKDENPNNYAITPENEMFKVTNWDRPVPAVPGKDDSQADLRNREAGDAVADAGHTNIRWFPLASFNKHIGK